VRGSTPFREHQVCIIGLKIDECRQLQNRAREVAALPEVRSVAIVTGRYDLLVEVLVPSNHGLIQFLSESLASVPRITSSETFLLLETFDKWIRGPAGAGWSRMVSGCPGAWSQIPET
jgi:Lrp/AsnC family transcriptional regulator for asnA, asnC and gidA